MRVFYLYRKDPVPSLTRKASLSSSDKLACSINVRCCSLLGIESWQHQGKLFETVSGVERSLRRRVLIMGVAPAAAPGRLVTSNVAGLAGQVSALDFRRPI